MMFKSFNLESLGSKSLKYFLFQTGFFTAFTYLTSGVFLSGIALLMGAGDVLVSYLSVIVNICGVLTLLLASFLERFTSRKKLTIGLTVLTKLFTLFIVVIPSLFPAKIQLYIFVPTVIVAFTLQAQSIIVLNQWMLGFMDEKKSGQYISLRQTITLVITVILSFVSGYWMDFMQGKYIGFVLLFSFAAFMGIGELILLLRTPDCKVLPASHGLCRFKDIATLPLKNKGFLGFVFYILIFYLLLTISDSFTMVYMMKYLALPYQTVTVLQMIISLPQLVLLGIWGKISDKKGHHFVLKASIWLFAGETIFLLFASPKSWFVFIPMAFLVAAVANAGFTIAVFNRRYELMPPDNRIVYDNFYTAVIGVGFIIGPMIGGGIKSLIEQNANLTSSIPFANIRLLYLISTIGILVLQLLYSYKNRKKG